MPTCGHLLKGRGYKGPFLSGVLPDKLFHMSRPNSLFQWEIKCVNSVKKKNAHQNPSWNLYGLVLAPVAF